MIVYPSKTKEGCLAQPDPAICSYVEEKTQQNWIKKNEICGPVSKIDPALLIMTDR